MNVGTLAEPLYRSSGFRSSSVAAEHFAKRMVSSCWKSSKSLELLVFARKFEGCSRAAVKDLVEFFELQVSSYARWPSWGDAS